MALKILFENATLQVADKPAGVDIEELAKQLTEGYFPAHRLDKDTSGVLLIAKNQEVLEYLQKQFQERKVEKTYLCVVKGSVGKNKGTIETLLGRSQNDRRKQKVFLPGEPGAEGRSFGASLAQQSWAGKREASTEYLVLKQYKDYAFLEVRPKTGRKHQIRAHMASLGHPVAGDKLYGFKNQKMPEGLNRQFLHAHSVRLVMPNGEEKEFVSELPVDLQQVLVKLET